jgi:hypothetical protein
MKTQPDDHEALREAVRQGLAVIVAGTGVSIAATYDQKTKQSHPQASWSGLLEDGLRWLKLHKLMSDHEVDAQLTLLGSRPQTHHLISIAEDITRGMGGAASPHFAEWLKRTVGSIQAHDRNALDALGGLRKQGNLLATTNYDGLLVDGRETLSPITWQDSNAVLGALRGRDVDCVVFLHGYWRLPTSVVLDWNSYDRIARDEQYRLDLAAFWKTSIWVYVGCGVNGLSDPDLGLLLERYGERARQAGHWDYCLVLEDQWPQFQAEFDSRKLNIRAVSFGKNQADLPKYLRSLLPVPSARAVDPLASVNRAPLTAGSAGRSVNKRPIPRPPAFYSVPDFIGGHNFIGRKTQLRSLDEWARSSDPASILLFQAIGGNGKSMLTWEWVTKRATALRSDWAGRFWYSFYEKGAIMREFCAHALAYMTARPLEVFAEQTVAEMRVQLVAELRKRPWLLVLDGLERVLVAYHRIDAAQVLDEDMNQPTDTILGRDPCDPIRDEDAELLRALAAAAPSKILVSSRLVPRALLNQSGVPRPGVKSMGLPGLDEADAEELIRSCGIQGTSADIRYYLTNYCGNHPLVIGVLAGLINAPGPHRGNFDAWAADSDYGAKLNLASLDLVQSRNHILRVALEALEAPSQQLLSTLSLLSSAVDYQTVAAFNPHLPPQPEEVEEPTEPEDGPTWALMGDRTQDKLRQRYEAAFARRKAYERSMRAWRDSDAVHHASRKLAETIQDLEGRGLLQFDMPTNRYDLHPVVRGVAAGAMKAEDREHFGQCVVDHFSAQPHNPYEEARTMGDVENGLHVVHTLLKLGRYEQAADAYWPDLAFALKYNLEAYEEALAVLRVLFRAGWDHRPETTSTLTANIRNHAANVLSAVGEDERAFGLYEARLLADLKEKSWESLMLVLDNIAGNQSSATKELRLTSLGLDLATVVGSEEATFGFRHRLFCSHARLGWFDEAEADWQLLATMAFPRSRGLYQKGGIEWSFAWFQYYQGALQEEHLETAFRLAEQDFNRLAVRGVHHLRGRWRLEQNDWALAAEALDQAVTMARERRFVAETSEIGLALAKFHLGQLGKDDARSEAERLAELPNAAHRFLARLWQAIGGIEEAKHHALIAYKEAWGDGEPFVERHELTKTTELLDELATPIPDLPPYDPTKDEPFYWEADIRAAIEELRQEQKGKELSCSESNEASTV